MALSALLALAACGSGDGGKGSAASTGHKSAGQADASAHSLKDGGANSTAAKDAGKAARTACMPDASAPVPEDRCTDTPTDGGALPACNQWLKVEPPGAVCSDGSQYKFFVNYSNKSNDLVVMFEPGGACWDYASCTGKGGTRGAANPHGIPDDHMSQLQYLNLLRRNEQNPAQDWNMVMVSYCTGDVHTGNNVATYTDQDTGDSITYRHAGHANVLAIVDWLKNKFASVPRMLVTGCSAGGIGALQNYYFLRDGLPAVQCGYLLDDSGPAFHSDGPSKQLHDTIRSVWNLDPLLDSLDGKLPVSSADLKADFGLLNLAVADLYPHDRLGLTLYRMDLNYSLYSYQRFFPGSTEADIHAMWWQDVQALMKTYDSRSNLAYYIPYFRHDNCSHCVSIPPIDHDTSTILDQPWLGSEIAADHLDLKDFTATLLDPAQPLASYLEEPRSETFTPDESAMCMQGG